MVSVAAAPKSPLAAAIPYLLNHWQELAVFLNDGRVITGVSPPVHGQARRQPPCYRRFGSPLE
jgi:hypothetical protein